MRIGAHVPVADGLLAACAYASGIGCECIQVFARNPRTWVCPPRDPEEARLFRAERARLGIGPLFTHASYLINLGSDDPLLWERSWRALADELSRAALIGADGVVVHAGTSYGGVFDTPVGRVADAVARAWDLAAVDAPAPRVVLENSSGAGRAFGHRLEDLCAAAESARVSGVPTGVCFDACHGFAAGIDVGDGSGWTRVCDVVESTLGRGGLRLVHANDCAGDLGGHRDRHAWIGDGSIGTEGFRAMFLEPRLAGVPAILEMPGEPPEKDIVNLERLRKLRGCA